MTHQILVTLHIDTDNHAITKNIVEQARQDPQDSYSGATLSEVLADTLLTILSDKLPEIDTNNIAWIKQIGISADCIESKQKKPKQEKKQPPLLIKRSKKFMITMGIDAEIIEMLDHEQGVTALDILNLITLPASDRLWTVLRNNWIDKTTLRLFSVWCAREALKMLDNPSQSSVHACNVAERYANGEVTAEDLKIAWANASGAIQGNPRPLWHISRAACYAAGPDDTDYAFYASKNASLAAAWTNVSEDTAKNRFTWNTAKDVMLTKQLNQLRKMLSGA